MLPGENSTGSGEESATVYAVFLVPSWRGAREFVWSYRSRRSGGPKRVAQRLKREVPGLRPQRLGPDLRDGSREDGDRNPPAHGAYPARTHLNV